MYEPEYLTSDPPRIGDNTIPAQAKESTCVKQNEEAVDTATLDDEDEEILVERLRSLGYIE
jgi:hypothetical protein